MKKLINGAAQAGGEMVQGMTLAQFAKTRQREEYYGRYCDCVSQPKGC
ncbi:hypothetical protein HSX37_07130|uniref:Uncharacterized protein n=1 Tax=Dendrosporobacter quercicolus TaxID=146817 RepID=A0A1G9VS22_9FIRM|nr:hypothetical protein [Dendrosporobacter quercicolus]NSL47817.1 hypothetical protein [Dendrosporobacter quercicolus DSM 1736]SDM74960.1 hypothetical protein SAMN04488502_10723 [Dendrosporobacter quercicolus]